MKIYIFGSNGMLGNYMKSYLSTYYEVISLTRDDYDLNNLSIDSLTDFLSNKNIKEYDVVINCAGVIPQASKQRILDSKLYFKINSLFPVILSMICEKFNTKMIHITTDCVFSGKTGNYNELSEQDETNDYGMSKSLGELCKATIIRTSIIGEELHNKRSLLEWVRSNKNKEINGFIKHMWNGVTCLQLAKIVNQIINEKLFWNGIRHIFSPRSISKYDLVSLINEEYQLNIDVTPLETELCDKTLSTVYDTNSLFNTPDLNEQINDTKEYMNFDMFVYCGGKCGGTTLSNTFTKYNYKITHLHKSIIKGYFNSHIDTSNIFNIIDNSSSHKLVYIIDSYRTPIERKISSYFQNIHGITPNYKNLSTEELIDFFNTNLLDTIEEYHSIDEVLTYYNIPLWKEFDFKKGYNIVRKDNKVFIKLLFKDIKNWGKLLSEILSKVITIFSQNLTSEKPVFSYYNKFKEMYKVNKSYIHNILQHDKHFKIYNTELEQEKYISEWLNKSQ